MSQTLKRKCQSIKAMVLINLWIDLCQITATGFSLARAYERLVGDTKRSQSPGQWSQRLRGGSSSESVSHALANRYPEIDALARHPLWVILLTKPQPLGDWIAYLSDLTQVSARRVQSGVIEPKKYLPILTGTDRLACLVILLKCSPKCCCLDAVKYSRSALNCLAVLCLRSEWYPARYALCSVLDGIVAFACGQWVCFVSLHSDGHDLESTIEAYRCLRALGTGQPFFWEVDEEAWAIFTALFSRLSIVRRREMILALEQLKRHPRPIIDHPAVFELYKAIIAVSAVASQDVEST